MANILILDPILIFVKEKFGFRVKIKKIEGITGKGLISNHYIVKRPRIEPVFSGKFEKFIHQLENLIRNSIQFKDICSVISAESIFANKDILTSIFQQQYSYSLLILSNT